MGEAFTRHSLRLSFEGELDASNSGAIAQREREVMFYHVVIASEAKQSRLFPRRAVWIASALCASQ
jgi:hypothetical protein